MPTDNELRNVARMLAYIDENEKRMQKTGDEVIELRQAVVALNNRVTDLMRQMQETALIGRGSGPTVAATASSP